MNRYQDRPETASDGDSFAKLCLMLMRDCLGENPEYCQDKWSQIHVGDTKCGVEFKHLQNSKEWLHIEIGERSDLSSVWRPSGIRCKRVRYFCGSDSNVFGFDVKALRMWEQTTDPPHVGYCKITKKLYFEGIDIFERSTVRSLRLHKSEARKICLYEFRLKGGNWLMEKNTLDCVSGA